MDKFQAQDKVFFIKKGKVTEGVVDSFFGSKTNKYKETKSWWMVETEYDTLRVRENKMFKTTDKLIESIMSEVVDKPNEALKNAADEYKQYCKKIIEYYIGCDPVKGNPDTFLFKVYDNQLLQEFINLKNNETNYNNITAKS